MVKLLIVCLYLFGTLVFFQNCSSPFQATDFSASNQSSTEPDLIPPMVNVSLTPPALTNQVTASFIFTVSDDLSGVAGTECSLDNASFTACTSPAGLSALSMGSHNFRIRATDNANNVSQIYSYSWTINLTVPTVTLTQMPSAATKLREATFAFTGATTYECQLDNAAYASCVSPKAHTNLADGSHTFRVRGTDDAGNLSAPVQYVWVIDNAPPVLTFTQTPQASSANTTATFAFTATDAGVGLNTVQCSLDNAAFSNCTSPVSLTNLSVAMHNFRVQASDQATNANLISYSFSVVMASPTPTPTLPPPTPTPTVPSGPNVTNFQITSSVGGSMMPFTLGEAFKPGDIPMGTKLGADIADIQIIPKNYWRDGSLKYAIVSGRVDLQANAAKTISLIKLGLSSSQAGLTTADLRATNVTATISYGAYGAVTWTGTDWNQTFINWITGPEMSSWIYRKPIGSDAHLVGWLEVRLYRGGAVEIVPWIENGYLRVAAPGSRDGVATFSINGSQRFSQSLTLLNHNRAMLGSGTTLSHWLGADPKVIPRHNTAYLQASKLVPSYRATVAANSPLLNNYANSYTPLGQHNYPSAMGTTGFHESIGPLPEWDVMYLVSSGDPRAYMASMINGYAAGRYGHHLRDETTNRALRMSQYPNLVINSGTGVTDVGTSSKNTYTPATSGATPPGLKNSHMPAIAFMPYLISGRWYFMDELQLLSAALFLKQSDQGRGFSEGRLITSAGSNQTRGAAWSLRTLVHTAAMTPDDDLDLKNEFVNSLQYNINHYHLRYASKPTNPLGLVEPYADYVVGNGVYTAAWWMDDFFTFAMGYMKEVQSYGSSYDTKINEFLAYKYKGIVGRLGPDQAGSHSYRRAAQYTGVYSPVENPNWDSGVGPWYANWGEAYVAMGHDANPAGNTLLGAYADAPDFAFSYWGNLQPAISYAVDQGVPGALEAYNRMTGASNWEKNASYFSTATPVWGVKPRTVP